MGHPSHFDRILGILCSVLDAYSAVLFLRAPEGKAGEEQLSMASSFSLGNKLDQQARIQEGKGLVGWIFRTREPVLVSNFDQRQSYLGYYSDNEEQSIKAFMGCALAGGAGVVCVDSKRQYSFSEKDQKILHLFSGLLSHMQAETAGRLERETAVAYYGALREVYTLRRKYSRWADFLRHFLDLMALSTGFAYCVLCTRDPDGRSYSVEGENLPLLLRNDKPVPSFPMTHGVVGWVFRNASSVVSEGPEGAPETPLIGMGQELPRFAAVMAYPLQIQRKTRGVLCLGNEAFVDIGEDTKDFVRMASEHLALFLENLYVKCRLRDLYPSGQAKTAPADPL
ncbi:MAG: GAF domain-containing protein [Deltaproteobacteria bacterium]|jgi:signal transduction protein with GAF and PtsI domain|nr:GAF domain-containing protein [Deltaproteobacteria bacterium]